MADPPPDGQNGRWPQDPPKLSRLRLTPQHWDANRMYATSKQVNTDSTGSSADSRRDRHRVTDVAAHNVFRTALQRLAEQSRLRVLEPRAGIDFTSNDYLGLATSERLARVLTAAIARGTPLGAGGSRLLRGNAPEHEELEAAAAAFFHAERTLFFSTGYIANFADLFDAPPA